MTRVLQGGDVIEKGACSFTLIQQGVLSAERAAAIRSRQSVDIKAGDTYSAAALSIVLHSRSPLVPTFRSDVRVFSVSNGETTKAWFGGGADLTPYYLDDEDISAFHRLYQDLANKHELGSDYTYEAMKRSCDDYFFLPARSEHRGTGGIFFDDLEATEEAMAFVQGVADAWTPSWFPIIEKHRDALYTKQQRQWQLLRRGRYLEFNLLYDRGVKFGLANANPRVEGVMVSAPPLIAWEYNHEISPGSPEAEMMAVLKEPREWV
jgi:coproporphyrinogen III oxidase